MKPAPDQPPKSLSPISLQYLKHPFPVLLFLLSSLFTPSILPAQDTLSLKKAIEHGLEANYQIRIARKDQQINRNNVARGNAGFLPTLRLTADQNTEISNTTQDFISGETINQNGAETESLNSRAELRWTLFDGFRMFTTYQRLESIRKRGKARFRQTVQEQVGSIIDQYYKLVQQKRQLATQQEALQLTRKRRSLAKTRMNIGAGSELAYRQVQSDYNADTASYLQLRQQLRNGKIQLNQLMGEPVDNHFTVPVTIPLQAPFTYQELKKQALQESPRIGQEKQNKRIAQQQLEEVQSNHYPEIGLNLGYDFSQTSSEAGFVSKSEARGFDYGFYLTYDLFNGFNTQRRAENARIRIERSTLAFEQEQQQLLADLKQAFTNYQESRTRVNLEKDNVAVAQETFQIARKNYQSGGIDYLTLKEAQQGYLDAQQRLTEAKYATKQAEVELMKLSGMLLDKPLGPAD
jgi:outer membrane protein TolC